MTSAMPGDKIFTIGVDQSLSRRKFKYATHPPVNKEALNFQCLRREEIKSVRINKLRTVIKLSLSFEI